jgi:hypothetical protein
MPAMLVSTPEIEAGAVVLEVCRLLIFAEAGTGEAAHDLSDVLDLIVINKDRDILRDAVAELNGLGCGPCPRRLGMGGPRGCPVGARNLPDRPWSSDAP